MSHPRHATDPERDRRPRIGVVALPIWIGLVTLTVALIANAMAWRDLNGMTSETVPQGMPAAGPRSGPSLHAGVGATGGLGRCVSESEAGSPVDPASELQGRERPAG